MSDCARRSYTEVDAIAAGAKSGRPNFRCQWCGDWHLGTDPGPVAPCWRCGTVVTIPDRGTPVDAATGWLHDDKRCRYHLALAAS